ncbi:hypothetical protein P280DRAFT_543937 [Massarina eburnea CBS 473.64]|uniref:C2H2-type domain-containing protein n=1 Tax=Massarina eburnea CBS 473.64 TaxID=1395130 RepID=A0A6A6S0D7_9PLEO|nr:hypothetical protein P280DRAFT_543937 [Massarina eburnea CBS 473.64]
MYFTRLGPGGLLEYDARYGVLICRECKYAIQKSALQSHLLRHKIYRDDRQRLLTAISQFKILEPDYVPLPHPSSPPIDALPLLSGFCCTKAACGHLCVSSKRMTHHQSEVHNQWDPKGSVSYRLVNLQTFFRGTKLRYFEVTPSPSTGATENTMLATTHTLEEIGDVDDIIDRDHDMHDAEIFSSIPPSAKPIEIPTIPSSVNVDLRTLSYFNHFTTATSFTLPPLNGHPTPQYWQTTFVSQALQHHWLMCGLLSISAYHLASLRPDEITQGVHYERAAALHAEFLAGSKVTRETIPSEHIDCVLCCAHWASAAYATDEFRVVEPTVPFSFHRFLSSVRGLATPAVAQHADDAENHSLTHARRVASTTNCTELQNLLSQLDELPSRMMDAFGIPGNTHDVLITLSAIVALAECCAIGFDSNELQGIWKSMTAWLVHVSVNFHDMIARGVPAALVVVAYWAASLVKRAQDFGGWYLKGAAEGVLRDIEKMLRDKGMHKDVVRLIRWVER